MTVYIPTNDRREDDWQTRNDRRCPVCGGALAQGEATIPYVLKDNTVVVVKNVPAEICGDCREAFTAGKVTDKLVTMMQQLKDLSSEVSVISYREYEDEDIDMKGWLLGRKPGESPKSFER